MTSAEKRIQKIESDALESDSEYGMQVCILGAICECARQLATLNDLYAFELGLKDNPLKTALYDVAKAATRAEAAPQFSEGFLDGHE